MAYNKSIADRIRQSLIHKNVLADEKKMFGGIAFMVDEKMCIGAIKNDLMARVGEQQYPEAIKKQGARAMDFSKRPMKGYIFVDESGIEKDSDLDDWVQLCLNFNPLAKKSKKKKS